MSIKINIVRKSFSLFNEGKIFFFSKKFSVFFLLKLTLKFAIYLLFKKFSSLISNDSIKYLISLSFKSFNFDLSLVVIIVEDNSWNALSKALLITLSLLKLALNGSDISISFILKILPMAVVEDNKEKIKLDKQIII